MIDSIIWPVTDEEDHYVQVFTHKDGRTAVYRRGCAAHTPAVEGFVKAYGNVAGLTASVDYHEAWPSEQVCAGCVRVTEAWRVSDGEIRDYRTWHNGFREVGNQRWLGLDWCPTCFKAAKAEVERENALILEGAKRRMAHNLGVLRMSPTTRKEAA